MIDITKEINFQTTRSGGKGGQNVNKVETAVIASFQVADSQLLTTEQKALVIEKLGHRLTMEGLLQVRSQTHRTQLSNKDDARKKMNELVNGSLKRKKLRIATKTTKAAKEKRLDAKKRNAAIKSNRRQFRGDES